MLGLTSFSKLDWSSYIIYITKTVSKKIVALIRSMLGSRVFVFVRLLCIFSYRDGYGRLLVLYLLPLLNH